MTSTYSKTFKILLAILFLLPLFFIPGGVMSLAVSKAILLSLGVIVASLVFILETWKSGKIEIPWHPAVLVAALLPAIYFLSALLTTPSSLSLFGYNFEVGTFGFVLLITVLLFITSVVVSDTSRILKALSTLLASFSVVALFALIKILFGAPVWGIFVGKTANLIGNWTDLATVLGLLAVILTLVLGMVPMTKTLRVLGYAVFLISLAIAAALNFSSLFVFTFVAAVIIFIYFSRMEKALLAKEDSHRRPIVLPLILGIVSLLFIINPNISASRGTLGSAVSSAFGLNNADIRPTFAATLNISKAVLSQGTLFGSGPNTFSRDWLIHKPSGINATPFWSANFSFGSGFIPTQIASTGLLGTILWLALLAMLLWLGIKALANLPEPRGPRFALVSAFLASVYLWTASFLYAPSLVVLALTFIFTALFISSARGVISSRLILFSRDTAGRLLSKFFLGAAAVGLLFIGYTSVKKTIGVVYFQKASTLSTKAGASADEMAVLIGKAVKFAPADVYYAALSRLYFAKAQQIAQQPTTDNQQQTEKNQAAFQSAISSSIAAARSAVALNSAGYENWLVLGTIYSALVPAPLSVQGAYENAQFAYMQAANRNPASPEAALLLAQLEVNNGKLDAARNYIRQAIILKNDYTDAYVLLARIEVQDKNIGGAIASTEKLVTLDPNNPSIYFELGLLKSSNNDNEGAVEAFSKALEFLPNYANAKYYLGLTLEKLGRKGEAKKEFEELLVTNPDSAEIKEALNRLNKK
ncbi:MAG: tetratricopeptide repeat protein [Candidatus Zambryskibacteria bacterium]|nr:tetratricopeptide repeat protein [Candidatus Zambryskibacteria bacterium]